MRVRWGLTIPLLKAGFLIAPSLLCNGDFKLLDDGQLDVSKLVNWWETLLHLAVKGAGYCSMYIMLISHLK